MESKPILITYIAKEESISVNPSENYQTVVSKEIHLQKTFAITHFCKGYYTFPLENSLKQGVQECGRPAIIIWRSVDTKHNYDKTWKECIECARIRLENIFDSKIEIANKEEVRKKTEELLNFKMEDY